MNIFRRRFLQNIGLTASAATVSANGSVNGRQSVTWRVSGFTCITCAVGLETVLSRNTGVLQVHAKYPEGTVRIEYDPGKISARGLKEAIAEMGFRVEAGA